MSKRRQLRVVVRFVHDERHVHTFNDWYDFADWLKQRALAHEEVTIIDWFYVSGGRNVPENKES